MRVASITILQTIPTRKTGKEWLLSYVTTNHSEGVVRSEQRFEYFSDLSRFVEGTLLGG